MEAVIISQYYWMVMLLAVIIIASFVNPYISLLLFGFSIPLETFLLLKPGFTLAKLMGIVLFGAWFMHLIAKRGSIMWSRTLFNFLIFLIWVFAASVYSFICNNELFNIENLNSLTQCFAFTLIFCNLIKNRNEVNGLIVAMAFSGIFGFVISSLYPSEIIIRAGRIALPGADQNESAFFCGGIILMLWAVKYNTKGVIKSSAVMCIILILLVFMILTGSRGGMLAFGLAAVVFIAYSPFKKGGKFLFIMAIFGF